MLAKDVKQRILKRLPAAIFPALGLKRWKSSVHWFEDRNWSLIFVEFQPISGYNAVVLNVGVGLLWYPKDYFSFDIGHRESNITPYESETQFESEVTKLIHTAQTKVLKYQSDFSNLETDYKAILAHQFTSEELWGSFHKGVISGLNQDAASAIRYFNKLISLKPESAFDAEIARHASMLRAYVTDPERFKLAVEDGIHQTRSHLNLPALKSEF
ncbi:MAG TPA: hypothetical protein DCF33_21980 [Saprospirales bacterium]|nr:hypothetical protein [Saprospirales bacterium]